MMLRERQIPPQPGCPFKVNRNFPESSIKIAMKPSKLLPSPNGDKKVKVLVNSFDASVYLTKCPKISISLIVFRGE